MKKILLSMLLSTGLLSTANVASAETGVKAKEVLVCLMPKVLQEKVICRDDIRNVTLQDLYNQGWRVVAAGKDEYFAIVLER